jgi:hypothetical protein
MTGLGVDRLMRRAGHDAIQTTLGYVKLAEDLSGGELGEPFAPLPAVLRVASGTSETGSLDLGARGGPVAVRSEVVGPLDAVDSVGRPIPCASTRVAVNEDSRGPRGDDEHQVAATSADRTLAGGHGHPVHPSVHAAPLAKPTTRNHSEQLAERAGFEPAAGF